MRTRGWWWIVLAPACVARGPEVLEVHTRTVLEVRECASENALLQARLRAEELVADRLRRSMAQRLPDRVEGRDLLDVQIAAMVSRALEDQIRHAGALVEREGDAVLVRLPVAVEQRGDRALLTPTAERLLARIGAVLSPWQAHDVEIVEVVVRGPEGTWTGTGAPGLAVAAALLDAGIAASRLVVLSRPSMPLPEAPAPLGVDGPRPATLTLVLRARADAVPGLLVR